MNRPKKFTNLSSVYENIKNETMGKTKDLIKDLIEKSGNEFHYQVVSFLREAGWTVLISPYYNDNITAKPREIDIVAEKPFVIKEHFGNFLGTLNIKFFVECKYINREIVFWFDDKDKEKAVKRIMRDVGLKSPDENSTINKHHYLKDNKVAKLFSSNPNKLLDNELIYKAINQSLNAMVYYKNSGSMLSDRRQYIEKIVSYPLIICNTFNKFYKVDVGNNSYSKIDDNFQLEINYAYLDRNKDSQRDYFLIDIVDFSNNRFDNFLKDLEDNDIKIIKERVRSLKWNK